MTNNHLPNRNIKFANVKLAGIIFALLFGLVNYPLQVQSQVATEQNKSVVKKTKPLPDSKTVPNGRPQKRQAGARRDGCPDLSQPRPLTALVPEEEKTKKSIPDLANTVSDYPTFWVYMPQRPESVKYGEFVLQDKENKTIYERKLTLPKESGIIGIDLPKESKYALQENNEYQWYFTLFCNEQENSSEYIYVHAWIKRIPLTSSLENQLKVLQKEDYPINESNQIWYDRLTIFAEKNLTNSNSHQGINAWIHLLKSIGLGELASAPIVMIYK